MMKPLIIADRLHVRYGLHEVLTDISFSVESGDFLAVVGPNGSGKTTLVKTLVGLLEPTSGTILLEGSRLSRNSRAVGYLPQKSSFTDPRFPAMVKEVVKTGLKQHRDQHQDRIDHVLKLLQIDHLADKRVGKLSGGQQQRVHLARALVGRPSLLVLDEPTGALDPYTRECFYTTLQKYNREHGVTIIIVTHDSHAVGQFARSILFLDRKVLFFGSMEEFNQAPSSSHYFNHTHGRGAAEC